MSGNFEKFGKLLMTLEIHITIQIENFELFMFPLQLLRTINFNLSANFFNYDILGSVDY